MGTWDFGIFCDDSAADIRSAFEDRLKSGDDIASATASMHQKFADVLADEDEAPTFWLAVAALQWRYGAMAPDYLARAQHIISTGIGLAGWTEAGETLARKRQARLEALVERLAPPNPAPSKMPRRMSRPPLFEAGDCLAIALEDRRSGAAIVLAADRSNPEWGLNLVAELDYVSESPPAPEVFEDRKWLVLTHGNWRSEMRVLWVIAVRSRFQKQRIGRVGTTAIRPTDPSHSNV